MNFLKNITFADIKISRASKIGVPTSLRTPATEQFKGAHFNAGPLTMPLALRQGWTFHLDSFSKLRLPSQ